MMSWLTDSPDFEAVSRMVLTLLTLAVTWWSLPLAKRFYRVRFDAYRFSRLQLRTHLPQNLLHRRGVFDSFKAALEDPDFNTVMLYGTRGAGKTTAIESVLQKQKGVVAWNLTANTYESATAEMKQYWKELFDPLDRTYAEDVCLRILHKYGRPLIVVVSVEAQAKPTALRSLLHFCKSMSYNTKYVRFVVDVSVSRVALDMRTDFVKLRLRKVWVGPLTRPEAHSFLMKQLPPEWTGVQKQTVSQEITSKLGCVVLTLTEICKEFVDGMRTGDALNIVRNTHRAKKIQAFNRLKEFDSLVATKLGELPNAPPPPSLKKEGGLDEEGLGKLTGYLTYSGFTRLIEELRSPYIFEIDPFTEEVELSGPVMKEAFVEHYG
mmetsp:Transcript_2188/g.5028  ORF Transcript_2188/g.5028 Transcript_2188/m.5028 type:complete len:378 (-) Transcript_2188:172-1305(-)